MNQAQNIRLPGPIYSQLKALAVARATTMVEVVASFLRQAVEAGEISADTAGVSAKLLFDWDAANEADQGPWVVVTSPAGDLPRMTREDAETVAGYLLGENTSPDAVRHVRANAGKQWTVEARGTSLKLTGKPAGKDAEPLTVTLAPVVARGLAQQMRAVAHSAVPDAA